MKIEDVKAIATPILEKYQFSGEVILLKTTSNKKEVRLGLDMSKALGGVEKGADMIEELEGAFSNKGYSFTETNTLALSYPSIREIHSDLYEEVKNGTKIYG